MSSGPSSGLGEDFYVAGGTLRPDAPSYVERQADQELLDALLKGEFCYALTSRQMGKSSLMVRTVRELRSRGIAVAVLDLTSIGQNLSAEQWYDGLMARLGQQVDLEDELLEFWQANERWGPLQRWTTALERIILPRGPGGLVIFIDELDVVRSLPFSTDEFFAAIRECYNRRSRDPVFQRITFCLLGVAAPTDLIRDTRLTPFNIGRRIELNDFTERESQALAAGMHSNEQIGRRLLQRVLYWTSGHPYLTQRLCRAVAADGNATSPADVDRHCQELFLSPQARERDDNLIFVRERLLNNETDRATLLDLYRRVRRGHRPQDDEANPLVSLLRLAGVVRGVNGSLLMRNRIYARVFDQRWIVANMPEAELRRQRAAFRRGFAWPITALAVLSVLLFVPLPLQRGPLVHKLPDGSTLTINSVSYGKEHRFDLGRVKLGWLGEMLPPVRRLFSTFSHSESTLIDSFFFGITYGGIDPAGNFIPVMPVLADETGAVWTPGESACVSSRSDHIIQGFPYSAFPRRERNFALRFYEYKAGGRGKLAEFIFENPDPGPHPQWTPEPMPVTKKAGEVSFNLLSLTTGVSGVDYARPAPTNQLPWTVARFGVKLNEEPTLDYEVESIEVSDATGNQWSPIEFNKLAEGPSLAFMGGLSSREDAYKLKVEFSPRAATREAQPWTITNVPLPAPGGAVQLQEGLARFGATIELHRIERMTSPAGGQASGSDECEVQVRLTPRHRGVRVKPLRITDQDGAGLEQSSWGENSVSNRVHYTLGFRPRPETKSLNFEFVVARSQFVEFLAKPAQAKPEQPANRVWIADPPNSTQRGEDWEVTLVDVKTGRQKDLIPDGVGSGDSLATVLKFQLTPADSAWQLTGPIALFGSLGFSDVHSGPAGGSMRFLDHKARPPSRAQEVSLHLGRGFFEDDLRKVRVNLRRGPSARFSAEESWEIVNVPWPKPGDYFLGGTNALRHGIPMEFLGITGAHARLPGVQDMDPQPSPACYFRVLLPGNGELRFLEAADERGRSVFVRGSQGVRLTAGDPRLWIWRWNLGERASSEPGSSSEGSEPKAIRLRVAVDTKPATVEFTVKSSSSSL